MVFRENHRNVSETARRSLGGNSCPPNAESRWKSVSHDFLEGNKTAQVHNPSYVKLVPRPG